MIITYDVIIIKVRASIVNNLVNDLEYMARHYTTKIKNLPLNHKRVMYSIFFFAHRTGV
jgi:hypothetical protein